METENTIITKSLVLTKDNFFSTHLSIINCVLPLKKKLTDMEIKVLSKFMQFEGDLSRDRFSTTGRKIVREELKLKPSGLSNYIRIFKSKGLLKKDSESGIMIILPLLFPRRGEQKYAFRIVEEK